MKSEFVKGLLKKEHKFCWGPTDLCSFLPIKEDFRPYKNKIIRLGSSDVHKYKKRDKIHKVSTFY